MFDGTQQPKGMRENVAEIKANLESWLEYMKIMAQMRREHYLACLDAGFDPKQALELSKNLFH